MAYRVFNLYCDMQYLVPCPGDQTQAPWIENAESQLLDLQRRKSLRFPFLELIAEQNWRVSQAPIHPSFNIRNCSFRYCSFSTHNINLDNTCWLNQWIMAPCLGPVTNQLCSFQILIGLLRASVSSSKGRGILPKGGIWHSLRRNIAGSIPMTS